MTKKTLNPIVKQVLEFGPVLLFLVLYLLWKDQEFAVGGTTYSGFIAATAVFIPVILLAMAISWFLSGTLSRMQVVTAVLVTVFGGLTLWLNDERFFKMKPTAIYLLFAGILGFGLLRGQSYLKYVMEEMMPLQDEGWMKLTQRFALMFLALAVINEVVWRGFSEETWVWFKTFGLMALMFVFILTQTPLFQKYAIEKDED